MFIPWISCLKHITAEFQSIQQFWLHLDIISKQKQKKIKNADTHSQVWCFWPHTCASKKNIHISKYKLYPQKLFIFGEIKQIQYLCTNQPSMIFVMHNTLCGGCKWYIRFWKIHWKIVLINLCFQLNGMDYMYIMPIGYIIHYQMIIYGKLFDKSPPPPKQIIIAKCRHWELSFLQNKIKINSFSSK